MLFESILNFESGEQRKQKNIHIHSETREEKRGKKRQFLTIFFQTAHRICLAEGVSALFHPNKVFQSVAFQLFFVIVCCLCARTCIHKADSFGRIVYIRVNKIRRNREVCRNRLQIRIHESYTNKSKKIHIHTITGTGFSLPNLLTDNPIKI